MDLVSLVLLPVAAFVVTLSLAVLVPHWRNDDTGLIVAALLFVTVFVVLI